MYCSLCKKIIDIRKKQNKPYYGDLCDKCKQIYMGKKKTKKKLVLL